jgi:hypothetical protein
MDHEHPALQKPNRTLLPKSPFFKEGLSKQFLAVPPHFLKGGRGDYKASLSGKNFWQVL